MSDSFKEKGSFQTPGEDNKVIQLPTRINKQHEARQKLQSQRFAAAVSLGSVILVSLFLNQFLNRQRAQHLPLEISPSGQRFIASSPENQSSENLNWEVRLAKDLNKRSVPVISAQRPLSSDQFLFGELRGQYQAVLNDQFKISKLQIIGEGSQVELSDIRSFLIAKREIFSVDFDAVNETSDEDGIQVYKLFKGPRAVGEARVEKNAFGNLKTLEIH